MGVNVFLSLDRRDEVREGNERKKNLEKKRREEAKIK